VQKSRRNEEHEFLKYADMACGANLVRAIRNDYRISGCRANAPATGRSTASIWPLRKRRDQAPQRSAPVCTGASHRAFAWPSSTEGWKGASTLRGSVSV
jgi:hypothetical protein